MITMAVNDMNPVIEAIKNRQSTRSYDQKPIPRKILRAIIEAGNQAPYTSMTRSQPWRFVVVEDQKFKQKLFQTAFPFWKNTMDGMKENAPELYEMATCLYNAMDDPKDVIYYSIVMEMVSRMVGFSIIKGSIISITAISNGIIYCIMVLIIVRNIIVFCIMHKAQTGIIYCIIPNNVILCAVKINGWIYLIPADLPRDIRIVTPNSYRSISVPHILSVTCMANVRTITPFVGKRVIPEYIIFRIDIKHRTTMRAITKNRVYNKIMRTIPETEKVMGSRVPFC